MPEISDPSNELIAEPTVEPVKRKSTLRSVFSQNENAVPTSAHQTQSYVL